MVLEDAIKWMKEHDTEAYQHITKIPLSIWVRYAFCPEPQSDHITNNICVF